jgi:hypothetical protein
MTAFRGPENVPIGVIYEVKDFFLFGLENEEIRWYLHSAESRVNYVQCLSPI